MKTYILAALAATTIAAHAQPFAETDNQGGGKIVLLTDPCPTTPSESRAYFYIKDGTTEDGCWKYDGDTVVAQWERQGKRRYPISYFRLRGHFRDFK
jgi:hypothetical protein